MNKNSSEAVLCRLLDEKLELDKKVVKLSTTLNNDSIRNARELDGQLPLLEEQYKAMIAYSALVTRRIAMLWSSIRYEPSLFSGEEGAEDG